MVTNEMVEDILVSAMEGGDSVFWTDSVVPDGTWPEGVDYASQCLTNGRNLLWTTDEGETFTLTLKDMKAGIRRAAEHYHQSVSQFYDEHDGGSADVAVQLALFNEIVYC